MTLLPQNFQGTLHIIQIPFIQGNFPGGYIAYIRPYTLTLSNYQTTQSDGNINDSSIEYFQYLSNYSRKNYKKPGNTDFIDEMILAAIQQKHPTATSIIKSALYFEGLAIDISAFRSWHPYVIHIFLHTPIETNFAYYNKPDSYDLQLNLYTQFPLKEISKAVIENIDKPECDYWARLSEKYASFFETVYPLECDTTTILSTVKDLIQKSPVKDLKGVLKEIGPINIIKDLEEDE